MEFTKNLARVSALALGIAGVLAYGGHESRGALKAAALLAFVGARLALLGGALGFLGWTLTADDQQALIDLGVSIAASVGGVVAIYGRIKASKKIG